MLLHAKRIHRTTLGLLLLAAVGVIVAAMLRPDGEVPLIAPNTADSGLAVSNPPLVSFALPALEEQARDPVRAAKPVGVARARIQGRVTDARSGLAVERFRVLIQGPDWAPVLSSTSVRHPEGRFDIAASHAGPWMITVTSPLHEDAVAHSVRLPCKPLELEARRATCLQGTLRDAEEQALEGVAVFLEVLDVEAGTTPPLPRATRSGPEGEWAFPKLVPGRYVVVVRCRSDELLRTPPLDLGVRDQLRHDLTVEAFPEVRVAVRADGSPVPRASVSLRAPEDGRYPSINEISNSEGVALARFLAAGSYELVVNAAGHTQAKRTLSVSAGRQEVVVDLH